MNRNEKDAGVSASSSPRLFRRKITAEVVIESPSQQTKVIQNEMEEKIKSMRQKRLDRLSTFVVEQSKLSIERSNNSSEENDIEKAIISMKQEKTENKSNFTPIIEEVVVQSRGKTNENVTKEKNSAPKTPRLFRKFSNESLDKSKQTQKSSNTKKFINKFNCAATTIDSSIEDLTKEPDSVTIITSEKHYNKTEDFNRNSLQDDKTEANMNSGKPEVLTEDYNPLLSPVGKQRRGIYLYETECQFLEHERSTTMSSFSKLENNSQREQLKESVVSDLKKSFLNFSKSNEDQAASAGSNPQKLSTGFVELKHNNEVVTIRSKPPLLNKNLKRNSLNDILDSKIENKISLHRISNDDSLSKDNTSRIAQNIVKNDNKIEIPIPKVASYENVNFKSQNSSDISIGIEDITNSFVQAQVTNLDKPSPTFNKKLTGSKLFPPRSPVPLPRRVNSEEKIIKKFQRNWDSLKDILENDSDVDTEEMGDLRKTYEETEALLVEYKTRLEELEEKSRDEVQELCKIKAEVENIGKEIDPFKGLKRDESYRILCNRLSTCLLKINSIKTSKSDILRERTSILKETENCMKTLENKVARNEIMLKEVLEDQVSSISTNILNITRV